MVVINEGGGVGIDGKDSTHTVFAGIQPPHGVHTANMPMLH